MPSSSMVTYFFRLSLAFVEFAGELLEVHVGGIGPRAEEISAEYSLFLVEDHGLGAKVRQHRLRCLLGETYVVHLEFGEILGVVAGDDSGDTV